MSEQASNAPRRTDHAEAIQKIRDEFVRSNPPGGAGSLQEILTRAESSWRDELFSELLPLHAQRREADGQTVLPADYLQQFPQYTQQIRKFFGNLPTATRANDSGLDTVACAPHRTPELPKEFGGYELLEKLGEGGMGVVYKARQLSANRIVALKLIRPHRLPGSDDDALKSTLTRFRTEAEAAAQLQHDHIVTVFDVGEVDGQPYYAMRHVQGESLYQKVNDGPLPPHQAARYVEQVARALAAAHSHGILHRDVKPHNVMVDAETDRALLTDFGLAKLSDSDQQLTATEATLGSPPYMSPEQTMDSTTATPATDVYGAGATLYHLLTGRPPFRGTNTAQTLVQVQTKAPVPPRRINRSVPHDLETITLKCLEKAPGDRIGSAKELGEELARYLDGRPIRSRPAGHLEKLYLWCKRNPVAASLLGAVAIVIVTTTLAMTFGYQAMRAGRLAELDTQLEQQLSTLEFAEEDVNAAEALIKRMEELSPRRAEESRNRLAAVMQSAIERQAQAPRLDNAVADELLAACELLKVYSPEQANALRLRIEERSWRTLLNIEEPYEDLATTFDERHLPRAGAAGLQWDSPGDSSGICLTRHLADANVELEAVFAGDWQQASEIGLAMFAVPQATEKTEKGDDGDADGVLFKLQATAHLVGGQQQGQRAAITFEERRQEEGGFFTLVVIRDGVIVQTGTLPAEQVPDGELTLWARQDGSRLSFQVNDNEQLIFDELFPTAREDASKLGLLWPADATLKRLTARRLAPAEHASPLEHGDLLYARGEFAGALENYRRQSEILDDPELLAELQFKRGQCLMELKRGQEARALWQNLVNADSDRWKAPAMISLWVLALEENRLDDARQWFDSLSLRYTMADLAVRIPDSTRDKIVTLAVDPVVVTSLRPHPNAVEDLQRALTVQNAVGVPFTDTFLTRWMLLGAYDREGELEAAVALARELLEQIDHSDFRHRLVLDHYVWLEARLGASKKAHAYLDRYLELNADGSVSNIAAALMMRGRLHASVGDWEAAGRAMDQAMEHYHWPPARIWMARGLVALKANQPEKADECWELGFAQNKSSSTRDSVKIVHTFMLGLLAGKVTKVEMHRFIAQATQSDFDSPAIRLVTQGMLPKTLFEESLLHLDENPRIMGLLEDWHFYRLSYEDSLVLPYRIVAQEAFTTFVLGMEHGKSRLSADQDELLWQATGELYEAFKRREFNELNIAQAFFTWKGNTGLLGWANLSRALPPASRGPTAYVFGCHYVHLNKHPSAARFFQTAWNDAVDDSLLGELTGQRLTELVRTTAADDAARYLKVLKDAAQAGKALGAARYVLVDTYIRENDSGNAVRQYARAALWRERTAPFDETIEAAQRELESQLPPEQAVVAYLAECDLQPESLNWFQRAAVVQTRLGLPEQAAENFLRAIAQRKLSDWNLKPHFLTSLLESEEVFQRTSSQLDGEARIDFLIARGQYFGSRGRWEEAAASYAGLDGALRGSYIQFESACLLLLAGQQKAYTDLCQQLVDQFADTSDDEVAGNCAAIAGLSSASGVEAGQLLKWSNLAMEQPSKYTYLKAAAGFYRAGEYQKAVDLLNESLARFGEDKSNAAFILALSYHRLGQENEAQTWRDVGEREIQKSSQGIPQSPTRWGHGHWVTVNAWRIARKGMGSKI